MDILVQESGNSECAMKVLHIIGGDLKLGAFRGAYWLHQGLRNIGVDSKILGFVPPHQTDANIGTLSLSRTARVAHKTVPNLIDLVCTMPYGKDLRGFNTGFFGFDLKKHSFFSEADIVNVHWYSNGVSSPRQISRYRKPTVITLRDMWPFTGGCHYAMGCEKYKSHCGRCPCLNSNSNKDLAWVALRNKKKASQEFVKVVGISDWISDCAQNSAIFCDHLVSTIDNCVDTSIFFSIDKMVAREALGLSKQLPVVLVGATDVNSVYKGWQHFVDAISYLTNRPIQLVTFGRPPDDLQVPEKWGVVNLGYLGDDTSLRLAYSAADVFVAPSEQEAFGKTIVEAMACGAPVVCFDATGPKGIVEHKVTGYKAKPFLGEALADGIAWILDRGNSEHIREECIKISHKRFAKEVVALQYKELYAALLNESDSA